MSTVVVGFLKSTKELPKFNGFLFNNGFYYLGGIKL
jgi:hypothetical protein